MFADDVKLYIKVVDYSDIAKLQQALFALCTWATEWQLGISVDKCNVLFIGKGDSTGQFCINGIPLPIVTEYRDLGITITHDLSPSDIIFQGPSSSQPYPRSTQPEYQLRLGKKRQVWLIPIADERVDVQVKL